MVKFIIIAGFMLFSNISWGASLNDYSILIPLPEITDFEKLIRPDDHGEKGLLIPFNAFDPLPQLVVQTDNRMIYKNNLRLIAMRLDPCFSEVVAEKCHRQIRLVWQPLIFGNDKTLTLDAAVHTFYEFDEMVWTSFLQEWKSLSSGQLSDPLQAHPVIKNEGFSGPFYLRLQQLLLQYCGEKNLVRITAMAVRGREQVWIFQGFNMVSQGALRLAQPISIPRVDSLSELAVFKVSVQSDFFGGLNPVPDGDSNFFRFVSNSQKAKQNLSEVDMKQIITIAFDYENPKVHNTASLDCVSCHLAQSVRRWGEQNFPLWNWQQDFKDHYASPWFRPIALSKGFQPNQFRAFGYFADQPVISQRVINETLAVKTYFDISSLAPPTAK